MASSLLPLLLRAALFAGLAIVVLLVLRKPLRRWLGPALAYQAWLLVPLVVIASCLPARPAQALQSVEVLRPVQSLAAQVTTAQSSGHAESLLLAWAVGALAMALRFALGQRAFLRRARAGAAGPASVGLLHPRIVLPRDFATRYSPDEQALVLAHERAHIARGDLHANLLAALLQCAFWFNPLVHFGARAFRQDQELACDAAVMRQHPRQRRAYAEALLKSHTGGIAPAGIHCHWQHSHPTKERIMSLSHTPPGTFRRLAGRCMLALLAAGAIGATVGARAGQATGPTYSVAMQIDDSGKRSTPRVLARAGESFAVASDAWRVEMIVSQADSPGEVWLKGKLFRGQEQVGAPTLRTRVGETATVKVGNGGGKDFSIGMIVLPQP